MAKDLWLEKLRKLERTKVYVSFWKQIKQDQINIFADATADHQWIHVDTEKAARGPFGATIAH